MRLRSRGAEASLAELVYDGSMRSTRASTPDGHLKVGTVEHLFAALGATSIYDGLVIEIDGPEVPIVDGGAGMFFDALAQLGAEPSPPKLKVVRRGAIDVGSSRYAFRPRGARVVEVDVDFGDPRLERGARWAGDVIDFRDRIAQARTFGFVHELEELMARGLASHVDPESVVVVSPDGILSSGRPFLPDEPARHKLLDLIGDLYAHGGPPLGEVRAARPGHAATHEAVRRALDVGILTRGS